MKVHSVVALHRVEYLKHPLLGGVSFFGISFIYCSLSRFESERVKVWVDGVSVHWLLPVEREEKLSLVLITTFHQHSLWNWKQVPIDLAFLTFNFYSHTFLSIHINYNKIQVTSLEIGSPIVSREKISVN